MIRHLPIRLFQLRLLALLLLQMVWAHLAIAAGPQPEPAAAEKPSDRFLRVQRNDRDEPVALQTSVVRYAPADRQARNVTIDLIGAVHIGDRDYYEQLNKLFEQYDAILYELVAPAGTRVPPGGQQQASNPVSAMQMGLKDILELEFQLEQIDYNKRNLVHADLSPEELFQRMQERGESVLQIFFRMMGQAIAAQSKDPTSSTDAELLLALLSDNRAVKLKRIMAEQFEDLEGQMRAFEGPNGSTIISERNKRALEVLARELQRGKTRIGIFYGAGHMPDLEKRLIEDFGLKQVQQSWITAWSLD